MAKKSVSLKIFFLLIFSTLLFPFSISAQADKQKSIDSLNLKLGKDSARIYCFRKVRPYASLDYRYAAIRTAPVDIKGVQLGVRLFNKHKIGLGGYEMLHKAKQKVKAFQQDIEANQELKLSYLMVFYEYSFIDKRYFELLVSTEAGGGKYNLNYFDLVTDEKISTNSDYILPLGAGLTLNLKPIKWVGLTGTVGYRYMFGIAGKRINFDGLFYSYGIWVDLRQVQRDIRFRWIKKSKYRKDLRNILASS